MAIHPCESYSAIKNKNETPARIFSLLLNHIDGFKELKADRAMKTKTKIKRLSAPLINGTGRLQKY